MELRTTTVELLKLALALAVRSLDSRVNISWWRQQHKIAAISLPFLPLGFKLALALASRLSVSQLVRGCEATSTSPALSMTRVQFKNVPFPPSWGLTSPWFNSLSSKWHYIKFTGRNTFSRPHAAGQDMDMLPQVLTELSEAISTTRKHSDEG